MTCYPPISAKQVIDRPWTKIYFPLCSFYDGFLFPLQQTHLHKIPWQYSFFIHKIPTKNFLIMIPDLLLNFEILNVSQIKAFWFAILLQNICSWTYDLKWVQSNANAKLEPAPLVFISFLEAWEVIAYNVIQRTIKINAHLSSRKSKIEN